MMRCHYLAPVLVVLAMNSAAQPEVVVVSSLADLAEAAAEDGRRIKLEPGVYRMADYLTEEVLETIREGVDRTHRRPPVPMFVFGGNNNDLDLRGVTLEIDTTLYAKVPQGGYTRCLIVEGSGNTIEGLTLRNTGPNQGSNGNILSVAGEGNTLLDVTLHVHGSYPFGYGDLLGKGGPNLTHLQKQSGIQVLGTGTTLRRCRVFSRAFGHCFYIQGGEDIRIEDCYAEGVMRPTNEMLRETDGPAFDVGFKSVCENRDGRFMITSGYMKSLSEDGFRTYGNAGNVTLVNCTAVNTRAGFEIGARDDSPRKTYLENCVARGCERAFLLGSHVVTRRCAGDTTYGPLLYLRGGRASDVELELLQGSSDSTVHALATIAGENHRVRLYADRGVERALHVPIMVGFGMPAHAEMSSPIRPAPATNIRLVNELEHVTVLTSDTVADCEIITDGPTLSDEAARKIR